MRIARGLLLALGTGALLLAGGCKSLSCNNPEAYASAQEYPPLKMPVGLDGPDTTQALAIPALNEPEVPRASDAACLEDPPVLDTVSTPTGAQPVFSGPTPPPPPEKRTRPVSPPR